MFYEGRITTTFTIDKDEIPVVLGEEDKAKEYFKHAKRKNGTAYRVGLYPSVLYKFEHNGKNYGFADDRIDWVKGEKLKAILECCDEPMTSKKVPITFDEKGEVLTQPETYFTCGCCGLGFKSTYKKQAIHDQDTGYGYCEECEH